jgi:hypothetical protein
MSRSYSLPACCLANSGVASCREAHEQPAKRPCAGMCVCCASVPAFHGRAVSRNRHLRCPTHSPLALQLGAHQCTGDGASKGRHTRPARHLSGKHHPLQGYHVRAEVVKQEQIRCELQSREAPRTHAPAPGWPPPAGRKPSPAERERERERGCTERACTIALSVRMSALHSWCHNMVHDATAIAWKAMGSCCMYASPPTSRLALLRRRSNAPTSA